MNRIITNEMQNDLNVAWNELEEVTADFDQLSNEEIINLLPTIKQRIIDARNWIGKYTIDLEELLPLNDEGKDLEQIFENAQTMHLQEFINHYKNML